MNDFIIMGRDNCPFCVKAKKLLENRELPHTYLDIGKDITREEILSKYPSIKTVPVVTYQGNLIGGYDKLFEFVTTNKLYGENYGNKHDTF